MTDATMPAPVGAAKSGQQKQLVLLAVLGVILLLAVVFFVLKPFGGSEPAPAPPAVTTPAPAVSAPAGGTATASSGAETSTPDTVPTERPARSPFSKP